MPESYVKSNIQSQKFLVSNLYLMLLLAHLNFTTLIGVRN